MRFTLVSCLALLTAGVVAQNTTANSTTTATATIPFYSAPNSFTPTATGNTAIPGSVIAITNTAGAGSLTDTFVYTAALSTVAPTGNVTRSASGAGASASNLQPDPKNLQTAAANSRFSTQPLGSATFMSTVAVALAAGGAVGGFMLLL